MARSDWHEAKMSHARKTITSLEILEQYLKQYGSFKKIAEALGCHPTIISHIKTKLLNQSKAPKTKAVTNTFTGGMVRKFKCDIKHYLETGEVKEIKGTETWEASKTYYEVVRFNQNVTI